MGRDKLALPWGNQSLLERGAAAVVGFQQKILVSREEKNFPGFEFAQAPTDLPMHASLRAGLAKLSPTADYFCVTLADQPFLEAHHYQELITAWENRTPGKDLLLPENSAGQKGNPSFIHRRYIAEILAQRDEDRGCAYLFQRYPERVQRMRTEERAYFFDLDRPEDYACAIS